MKLYEVVMTDRKAKFERGLKKSRALRAKKEKNFEKPEPKQGMEIQ